MQGTVVRLMAGRTSIVIAHRLSTDDGPDSCGRAVEEGRHEELVRREGGTYRLLFERPPLGLMVDDEKAFADESYFSDIAGCECHPER